MDQVTEQTQKWTGRVEPDIPEAEPPDHGTARQGSRRGLTG
jgi:hypothetical protein